MKKVLAATLLAGLVGGTVSAQAYEQGDWIVRIGATTVAPNEDSDNIVLPTEPPTVLKGVSVSDDTQLGLIGAYMISDNFGIELLAATPFEHDISVKGVGIDAGTAQQLPPTLSFLCYPSCNQEG